MSIDARLGRLMPVLSARERGILVLRSLKEGTEEDPLWRLTMPPSQVREFNRYIGLMNACNIYLSHFITVVEQWTEQVNLKFLLMLTVGRLDDLVWDIAKLVSTKKRAKVEKMVENGYLPVDLPWAEKENSYFDLAGGLYERLREGVVHRWQELRAIEIVVEEVAQEFDGEDPLRPILRETLEKTKGEIRSLHEHLSKIEPLELLEPEEEIMAALNEFFARGKRLSG